MPLRGVINVAEKIRDQVDQELYSEDRIQMEIVELHLAFEMKQIDETDFIKKETELLQRLHEIKQRQADAIEDYFEAEDPWQI
ncbi:MAG: gas vesicle protein GvpG [Bacillota bacterium]